MTEQVQIKRGDTLALSLNLSDTVTGPQDITAWTIRSQVRQGLNLVDALDVAIVSAAAGNFTLRKADTTAWPTGSLNCDVEFTLPSGDIVSTETFKVKVLQDVTV